MTKKRKRKYTMNCKAGVTKELWYMLAELKIKLHKSKAQIVREALAEYYQKYNA